MCLKLFDKSNKKEFGDSDLPRICRFCEYATLISDEENVLCSKHGIVSVEYRCRKFSYDPLKRAPKIPPVLPKFDPGEIAAETPLFMFGAAVPQVSGDTEAQTEPEPEQSGTEPQAPEAEEDRDPEPEEQDGSKSESGDDPEETDEKNK